ncbi:MAG: SpoIIE family protein phosphatase [Prevotella sp.]|nr:SpoIIE family protein phosphatase [Prevotella sp.]
MKHSRLWMMSAIIVALTLTACGNGKQKEQGEQAEKLINEAYQARDYNRLLQLADSLETDGSLSQGKAYYWLGYASNRQKQERMAEFYWKTSVQSAENEGDMDIYAKSASRLADLLCLRGDYEGTLKVAEPVVEKLEELKCDTTADYVNLLIYIGCSQTDKMQKGDVSSTGFDRAYQKHLENIGKHHSDPAYKNAIAGLTNIAYYCNFVHKYENALDWIGHLGELLTEYEQRPNADINYADKQVARYNIYKAIALEGLEKQEEAAEVYEAFLATKYSKTPEGRIAANDYLLAAKRWDEAAVNYRSLDALLATQQNPFTIDNIHELVLKKYHANLTAGRRDSAIAVSMQICDSLDNALALAKQLEAKEQVTIVKSVEKLTEQQEAVANRNQLGLFIVLGVLFLCFIGYAFYRRFAEQKQRVAYRELQKSYELLEANTTAKERTATERRIAHDIQQALVPTELPQHKRINCYVSTLPGEMSGSCLYDCVIRDEKLFFCIGDAINNDVKASALTATTKQLFRALVAMEDDPERIANNICQKGIKLLTGVIDLATGRLTFCNKGHDMPLVVGKEITRMAEPMTLTSGTMLYFYSDGLLTSTNSEQKVYGEKRMLGAALQAMKLNPAPKPFTDYMTDDVSGFMGEASIPCDIIMMTIRYK